MPRWRRTPWIDFLFAAFVLVFLAFWMFTSVTNGPAAVLTLLAGTLLGTVMGIVGGRADARKIAGRLRARGAAAWDSRKDPHPGIRYLPWAVLGISGLAIVVREVAGLPAGTGELVLAALLPSAFIALGVSLLTRATSLPRLYADGDLEVKIHGVWSRSYRRVPRAV